jgi:hypothetical protein
MKRRTAAIASALAVSLLGGSASAVGPHALTDVSLALLRAYNAEDAPELHRLLASSLQTKFPVETLRRALTLCRVLTYDIDRLSTPVWGGRTYGYFAVYAEAKTFEMVLEIDQDEKIVHWLLTDDLAAAEQQCKVSHLD